ncbi:MAG: T9SS type A sorting domain-containing protein [Bacteroidetes bacterium]|nr:T9SS type A sorting domain-containing protein [Bacteroidota bacterium]
MKKILLFIGLLIISSFLANAQKHAIKGSINTKLPSSKPSGEIIKRCGTTEHQQWMIQQNPELKEKIKLEEKKIREYIASHQQEIENSKAVYKIPCVVHIVKNGNSEDISDARVIEQINQTNLDWAGANGRSMGAFSSTLRANTQISLCLASVAPNGSATTGITRTSTTVSSFSDDDKVKHTNQGGCDAWDATRYFNIWVCDLPGLCGYAQLPQSGIDNTYGVVINYGFFGLTGATAPYNKGGTLSHEGGHCFGLEHIWGDDGGGCSGNDQCGDTPNQDDATYGNHLPYNANTNPGGNFNGAGQNSTTLTDACSTSSPGIMYMNFMDYCDDSEMANMTPNQKTRMQAFISQYLMSVVNAGATVCSGTTETQACDTLHYPLTGTATIYGSDNGGYVSGNNGYLDKAKAEYFATYSPYTKINSVILWFGVATHTGNTTNITVNVWKNDGTGGAPGTVIGTTTVPLATIVTNVDAGEATLATFSTPVNITGPFYIGVTLPTVSGDTIALVTNTDGDSNPATGWEKTSGNTWQAYSAASPAGWESNISNAIFPIVCTTTTGIEENYLEDILIYPNPANDVLNIDMANSSNSNVKINVYNSIGKLIKSIDGKNMSQIIKIDLASFNSGIYFVSIQTLEVTITKKISIIK